MTGVLQPCRAARLLLAATHFDIFMDDGLVRVGAIPPTVYSESGAL